MKTSHLVLSSITVLASVAAQANTTPNYHIAQLELDKAWQLTQGASNIKVAILATGVNYRLPELVGRIDRNPGETGNGFETDGVDNDGNGYIDDVFGVNTLNGTGDPLDSHGVGTYEATVMVSKDFGVAPGVKVIPIAVCDGTGLCTFESIIKGLAYAKSRGAQVIYMGLGGRLQAEEQESVCGAIQNTGALVIATAGNDGIDLSAPGRTELHFAADCAVSNLIINAATDQKSELASFSNYGHDKVHLAAPGLDIPGVNHLGRAVNHSGTSISGAISAGVSALVMSYHPEYSLFQVKEAMIGGADQSPALAGKVMSGGRLNAYKALTVPVVR